MVELAILLVGIVIGMALAALVSVIRQTPVVGGPEPSVPAGSPPARTDAPSIDDAGPAPDPMLTANGEISSVAVPGISVIPSSVPGRLRFRKTTVKQAIQVRVEPDGVTITIDGTTYHALDEIADPATREQVRTLLGELPAAVTDPVLRAKVSGELEELGITPPDTSH